MDAIDALKTCIIEAWEPDEEIGDCSDGYLWAGIFRAPFDHADILADMPGTVNFAAIDCLVGAILTINSDGFKHVYVYESNRELNRAWRYYQDELLPMDYTVEDGNRVTVFSGSGRSVAFLQDEDGSRLADELEACDNDEQVQTLLSNYAG